MALDILLVDDSATMRKLITRALRQTGLDVDTIVEAGNGVEALEKLDDRNFVICDWNMPEMDGLEFVKKARESSTTPIMMLSTEGTEDKISAAMDAGANGYVTKPFTPDKLGDKIQFIIDN